MPFPKVKTKNQGRLDFTNSSLKLLKKRFSTLPRTLPNVIDTQP